MNSKCHLPSPACDEAYYTVLALQGWDYYFFPHSFLAYGKTMLSDSRRAVVTGDLPAAVGSGFVALVRGEAERLF